MIDVTSKELEGMIEHWLSTPANKYLGSSYGNNIKSLLQSPQSDIAADQIIRKLVADIPLLSSMPSDQIAIYGVPSGVDRVDLVLEIAGASFNLGSKG